jgi:hypothetical protein
MDTFQGIGIASALRSHPHEMGPLLRAPRPHTSEWAKVEDKRKLIER